MLCASLCFINRDALRFYFLLPDYEMSCFRNPVRHRVVVEDVALRTAPADPDTFRQRPGIETGCLRHVEKDVLCEDFIEETGEIKHGPVPYDGGMTIGERCFDRSHSRTAKRSTGS